MRGHSNEGLSTIACGNKLPEGTVLFIERMPLNKAIKSYLGFAIDYQAVDSAVIGNDGKDSWVLQSKPISLLAQ